MNEIITLPGDCHGFFEPVLNACVKPLRRLERLSFACDTFMPEVLLQQGATNATDVHHEPGLGFILWVRAADSGVVGRKLEHKLEESEAPSRLSRRDHVLFIVDDAAENNNVQSRRYASSPSAATTAGRSGSRHVRNTRMKPSRVVKLVVEGRRLQFRRSSGIAISAPNL